jgi:hypothetical protein
MRSSKRGFLLLEVCLGIFLSVLISSTLAYWHARLLVAHQRMTKRSQALCLARTFLETFKITRMIPAKDPTVDWQIIPTRLSSFKRVIVTVKYGEESIRLETGIAT